MLDALVSGCQVDVLGLAMRQLASKAELILALLVADATDSLQPTAVVGITRLEKLLFLLKQEGLAVGASNRENFSFVPFKMGPWSEEVYDEVDFLESLGLLNKRTTKEHAPADAAHDDELFSEAVLDKYQKDSTRIDGESEVFTLSERGRAKALDIWNSLSESDKRKIIQIKRRFNKMSLRQLLRYVYATHPDFTSESEIKGSLGLYDDA